MELGIGAWFLKHWVRNGISFNCPLVSDSDGHVLLSWGASWRNEQWYVSYALDLDAFESLPEANEYILVVLANLASDLLDGKNGMGWQRTDLAA